METMESPSSTPLAAPLPPGPPPLGQETPSSIDTPIFVPMPLGPPPPGSETPIDTPLVAPMPYGPPGSETPSSIDTPLVAPMPAGQPSPINSSPSSTPVNPPLPPPADRQLSPLVLGNGNSSVLEGGFPSSSALGDNESGKGEAVPDTSREEVARRWGARDVSAFKDLVQVGEGMYGQVYRANERDSGNIFALKKILFCEQQEGFPMTTIREIKILSELDHPNIVGLKEIVTQESGGSKKVASTLSSSRDTSAAAVPKNERDDQYGSVFMVFEYCAFDLNGLLHAPNIRISPEHCKSYIKQLLAGVAYIHKNKILHRDLKSSNLLITKNNELKIGDWGLARQWNPNRKVCYSPTVVTLWYRCPEILLGERKYGPAIDIWSVGCIFCELLIGENVMNGKSEVDQLDKVFSFCGSPNLENWPEVISLKNWSICKNRSPRARALKEKMTRRSKTGSKAGDFGADAIDLLDRLLTLNPNERISAEEALSHDYFLNEPRAKSLSDLPLHQGEAHEWGIRRDHSMNQLSKRDETSRPDQKRKKQFTNSDHSQKKTAADMLRR